MWAQPSTRVVALTCSTRRLLTLKLPEIFFFPASGIHSQPFVFACQATEGDIASSQPWAVQVEARAKWDAWNSHKVRL